MVKKKNPSLAAGTTSSGAAAKAPSGVLKRGTSDASAPAPPPPKPEVSMAGPAPDDWPASTTSKRDEKRARSLGIISADEGNVILPGAASRPNPPASFTVMFMSFLSHGLSLPVHEFLRRLLHTYEIQLLQLTPNSILHLAIFITLCEVFLGIEPHFGLWKKIFFVKRYNCSSGSFVTGGVGYVVRKEVNYLNFPMRESVQGWRLKWFYIKGSSTADTQLPRFTDFLEAVPRRSWKNILSPEEKPAVDKLFENVLRIKEFDGQTMMAEEANVLPLKRSSGGFADEDDLDLDEAFIEPPPRKTKPSSDKPAPAASEASAPATAPTAQVIPVSSFTEGPSNGSSEKDRPERMKSRIAQMEKGMRGSHAMAAIIKKKGELATDAERYALMELHKATESLNWNLYSKTMVLAAIAVERLEKNSKVIPVSSFTEGPSNGSSEKDRLERMKSRIAQMEKGMRVAQSNRKLELFLDEDIPTSLLPPSLPTEDEPAVKLKSNEVRIGPMTRARVKLLKQQVSRGDKHRTRRRGAAGREDGREAGHGAGHEDISWTREGGAGGMREETKKSSRSSAGQTGPHARRRSRPSTVANRPAANRRSTSYRQKPETSQISGCRPIDRTTDRTGRDNKIVNQENKNSADIITWREYEALRNEMRREFRIKDDELKSTVDEIKQTLDATNVTVTGLSDQMTDIQRNIADMRLAIENLTAQQQQDDDEDPELADDAHNARGA
ncbi:hypothetical protein QYE76_043025 [Lolium multiflorum]|uniref:Transposase (putative) gypsy type domain-containing protein n=1 Tax=Lolium multiflorum TaxID=4521 RepID=A0AAD8TI84_LOLMU|nr:hypothetical protein QYE76_043025 [Lolium multiflorum]